MATTTEVRARTELAPEGRVLNGQNGENNDETVKGVQSGDAYNGKEHRWARSPTPRGNSAMFAYIPYAAVLACTLLFHESAAAARLYTYANTHYTPFQISFWGSLAITTGLYWAVGLVFMAFDLVDALHALVRPWKIQPDARPTWEMYKDVMRIAARNALCVNVPLAFVTSILNPFRTTVPLPSVRETLGTFFLTLAFEEVGFYCVHRTFHTKRFYAKVHKMHHRFTAPCALAGTYATMTEHFWSNLFPVMIPFYLSNAHFSCAMAFFASLLLDTTITHSGYNLPYLINALKHDWHHYAFTENFGPIGIVDSLMGTNSRFNAWLAELKRRDGENWLANGRVEMAEKTE